MKKTYIYLIIIWLLGFLCILYINSYNNKADIMSNNTNKKEKQINISDKKPEINNTTITKENKF